MLGKGVSHLVAISIVLVNCLVMSNVVPAEMSREHFLLLQTVL
jgi:hypothetical protein